MEFFEAIAAYWNSLVLAQQIFVCIAVPATVVLLVQIILMLIGLGGGGDADVDADLDGDGLADVDTELDSDVPDAGLSFFTMRGIVAMLTIMGWSGLVFLDPGIGIPMWAGFAISVILGILTLVAVAFTMRGISRLQQSGNLDIRNAIGKVGQVYLTIPAAGNGSGKVSLTIQEQYKEFAAITTFDAPIKTGAYVRVVALSESGTLVVEPINKH